jgi:hypothetical protein
MKWRDRTIDEIAEMICTPQGKTDSFFVYRSSYYITRFFRDADTDYVRDGTGRAVWTAGTLVKILEEPHPDAQTPPDTFCRVIASSWIKETPSMRDPIGQVL